jgi:hypothetical protein
MTDDQIRALVPAPEEADSADPAGNPNEALTKTLAKQLQRDILAEELGDLAEAVRDDRTKGSARTEEGNAFLAAMGRGTDVTEQFKACHIGEERLSGQLESPRFAEVGSRAGVVASAMLAAQPQAALLRVPLSALRTVFLTMYRWVGGPKFGRSRSFLAFLAGLAIPSLAIGLAHDNALITGAAVLGVVLLVVGGLMLNARPVMVAIGLAGIGLILAAAVAAIANGTTASRLGAVGLVVLATLLAVGTILPTEATARRRFVVFLIPFVLSAGVVWFSVWPYHLLGNPGSHPITTIQSAHNACESPTTTAAGATAKISAAPANAAGAVRSTTDVCNAFRTGSLTGAIGALWIILLLVGLGWTATTGRKRRVRPTTPARRSEPARPSGEGQPDDLADDGAELPGE